MSNFKYHYGLFITSTCFYYIESGVKSSYNFMNNKGKDAFIGIIKATDSHMIFTIKPYITEFFFFVIILLLSACSTTTQLSLVQPNPIFIEPTGVATAGAISVDITPPPSMAMGGYSVMANNSVGFRTRLKARVIYINDGQGNATALVQADLTSASLLLQQQQER